MLSARVDSVIQESFVHVGRRAVFDATGSVVGYELRFRANPFTEPTETDSSPTATARVIIDTFTQFGLNTLVGSGMAFLNLNRPLLSLELLPAPFVSDRVVLEILTDIAPDPDVVEGCERLVALGYRLALDDLTVNDERLPLLELASFAKLDPACTPAERDSLAARCREAGVVLVAKKVDDEEALEAAKALGCTLFQGNFLARPQVLTAQALNPQRLQCLQLLGMLSDPEISLERIQDVVAREPALTLRVLTMANSAASGLNRRINTVREALVLIGTKQLRNWLQLMLLSDLADETSELFASSVIRAKTCELLAEKRGGVSGDRAFTVGLLSSLEEVLGQPLGHLVDKMELDDDLREALISFRGPAGRLLAAVRRYEAGRPALDPEMSDVAEAFLHSLDWWHGRIPVGTAKRR